MFVKIALNKYCLEISQENTKKPNNPQIKTHESISYPWKHGNTSWPQALLEKCVARVQSLTLLEKQDFSNVLSEI